MTALVEAYYRRLYAFHEPFPVIPMEEFYNPNHDPKDGKFTSGPGGKIGTGGKGGKVWTGVSADPYNRVKPKSKVHFPIEPDDFETPGEARARFGSSIYDADLGDGYQARVTGVRVIPNGISVVIKIRKGHEEVGEASRELTTAEDGRLIAHHETLYIAGKHQGLGIADRFNAHAVAEYQRLGVDHIDLHAGDSVGGYAWARQGYRIFEGDRKKFLNRQLDRLETQLKIPALRPHAKRLRADAAVLRKAIEAGEDVQPIHLASLGEKYARHTARDDHRREYPTWPGKSLLIGTTWLGQYYFDANRAVTAAATDLEHAALRSEEFYNKNHNPLDGRFSSGNGVSQVSPGARVWWRMDGGSAHITQAAYDIVGGEGGSGEEHVIAQDMLAAINSQPVRTTPLFSGHLRDAQHAVGDVIDVPLMALGYRRGLALAYAGIDMQGSKGGDPLDTIGNRFVRAVMDGLRVVYPGKTNREIWDSELPEALRDQIGQSIAGHRLITEHRQPATKVIYEFASSKSALIAEGFERATSGKYKVSAVNVVPIKGSWLWDQRSHELVPETYTVVKLDHVGDLSITASAEEFFNKNHDPLDGRFSSGSGSTGVAPTNGRKTYPGMVWVGDYRSSRAITGYSAEMLGIKGYDTSNIEMLWGKNEKTGVYDVPYPNKMGTSAERNAREEAGTLIDAVYKVAPVEKTLWSGQRSDAFAKHLKPGDTIDLPTTATTSKEAEAHYYPKQGGTVFRFEGGTKAVRITRAAAGIPEWVTAGRFVVSGVAEKSHQQKGGMVREITLHQTHVFDRDTNSWVLVTNRAVTAAAQLCEHGNFACYDASCRPPTSGGTGGSRPAGSVSAGPRAPKLAHLSRDETRVAPNTTEFGQRINALLDKDKNLKALSKKTIDAEHEKRLADQHAIDEDEMVRNYTVGTPRIEMSRPYRTNFWRSQPGNMEQGEREDAASEEMQKAIVQWKAIRQEGYEPQNQSERILQNAGDKRLHHEDMYAPLLINGDFGQLVLHGARQRNLQRVANVTEFTEQAVIRVGHEIRKEIQDRVNKLDVDAVETHHIDTMMKINALAKEVYGDEAQVSISRFRSDTEANINVSGPAEKEGRFRQNLDKDHPAMVKIRALVNDSGINTHRQADHVANFQNREHQRITHEVLSEITQLGGRLDGTPKNVKNRWGSVNSHDQVVAAVKNYPDSWVGASNASTTLKFRQTSGRAHYQHSKNDGKSEITLDGSIATAVHEFAHRFERTVPGVLGLEARFHDRRTAGEKEVKMGAGYGRNEVTKPDEFFERYAGKTYHGNAFELMSMGYEHLRSKNGWGRIDDDYKAFVLGTLVSAYRG